MQAEAVSISWTSDGNGNAVTYSERELQSGLYCGYSVHVRLRSGGLVIVTSKLANRRPHWVEAERLHRLALARAA